jgi:hypothetical protein
MSLFAYRRTVVAALALVAVPACRGAAPSAFGPSAPVTAQGYRGAASPDDGTSILNKLTKDVLIGSTVDPKNGDTGPWAVYRVRSNYGLKKGQLLVCNFADAAGAPGKGTTVEVFNPQPNSKPAQFVQNGKVEGCDGDGLSSGNQLYAAGQTSKVVAWFNQKGKYKKTYGPPIQQPLSDGDVYNPNAYSTEYLFVGDAKTGGVVNFAIGGYGNPKEVQVVSGFAVSGSGWTALGPSGMNYSKTKDVLYIVDGVTNTVISVSHPGSLLEKNEIVVQPGGKTFKCLYKRDTCAKLVYAGSPLDAPLASTLLPNGNLIVANTQGGNTLVEFTPGGQVLATKVIDQSQNPGIFGLLAVGSGDNNTALFYTDANSNELHELEQ